jgi:hypothetical protein
MYFHVVLRLRMCLIVQPLSHACVVFCIIKHRDSCTFVRVSLMRCPLILLLIQVQISLTESNQPIYMKLQLN